ncbi:MAG: hypothetical protein HC830_14945 [Bacteroidetes bacterium]|nr:hypothetical protein [Bacteroidota bacterium]
MKINFTLLLAVLIVFASCSKEDSEPLSSVSNFTDSKYIKRIIPATDGYWLITSTADNSQCWYCNDATSIDGLVFFNNDITSGKDKLGVFLDAELSNNDLTVLSPTQIISFSTSLQSSVMKQAATGETFKLMDKDANGNLWFLSDRAIFNLEGNKISFPNSLKAIDFEISADNTFWIATADTVYRVNRFLADKFIATSIYERPTNSTTSGTTKIFNLRIDSLDRVWINTSDKVFRFTVNSWSDVQTGKYLSENFKTIPFMDIDRNGWLWLAEKNYQSYTDMHYYNGTAWASFKFDTPLNNWITDVEAAEAGYLWIGTNSGLLKVQIH